jgi:glycosyltransferase involved in cell wall biosynthesis
VPAVKKLLAKIQPDLVNAHYASGYATTARLAGYHPWILSVWGSDVYDFPYKSKMHKWLIKKNIRAADCVASTSHCMAEQIRSLTPELSNIAITPFGVDMKAYDSILPVPAEQKSMVVIGTVKSMRQNYGIDTLIEAFAILSKYHNTLPSERRPELHLRLVGCGDQVPELKVLARQLGVAKSVEFVGRVVHAKVPHELAKLDIYVALSRKESFGVAIIEASAAGRPVVVSDVGGLPEVIVDGKTGFLVPSESPQAAANALSKLVMDADLRHSMGVCGQLHVANHYSWEKSIETMLDVYKRAILKLRSIK